MLSEPRKKLRVVLDSNVLISALGFQKTTRIIWDLVEEGQFDLFVSTFILSELERGLVERVGFSPERAQEITAEVESVGIVEFPNHRISAIKDDDSDNAILECALEAKADVIVTGNMKHVRPLGSFRGISILTPREFLDKYFP